MIVAFKKISDVILTKRTRNTYDGSGELVETTLSNRLGVSPKQQSNGTGKHGSENKLQRRIPSEIMSRGLYDGFEGRQGLCRWRRLTHRKELALSVICK